MSDYEAEERERQRRDVLANLADIDEAMYHRIRSLIDNELFRGTPSEAEKDRLAGTFAKLLQAEIAKVEAPLRIKIDAGSNRETNTDGNLGEAEKQLKIALAIMTLAEHRSNALTATADHTYLVRSAAELALKSVLDARLLLDAMPF